MELIVEELVVWSGVLIPILAFWAIVVIYTQRPQQAVVGDLLFLCILLIVAAATIRTVAVCDDRWFVHATSLASMVLSGVLRRPGGLDLCAM